jgi:enoyl-CoA hydratase/carnithine racemase
MSTDSGSNGTVVNVESSDGVTVVHLDDGKANALTHDIFRALHAAFDEAEADDDVGAVAIIGRPGRFSAGFDLSVMTAGPEQARGLLQAGGELGFRMFELPKPVVLGCTGHALAMGAILLMSGDVRIGAEGSFKIGLNEVGIGMPVPRFVVELARERLSPRHFSMSVGQARIFSPSEAVDAGFLDRVVEADDVEAAAIEHAKLLATSLHRRPFELTRSYMRAAIGERLRAAMATDLHEFTVEPG